MGASNLLSAAEAATLIAAGRLTAVQLAEDCLARVAERDDAVHAWAHIEPRQVLAAARARDAEVARGPLHGIPVAIKDIIDTADMPTEYGSPIYAGHRPRADAACVALLKNAGAVIMGKTVTSEFGRSHPGKTRNPINAVHTPGGSSSGSAAAVSDWMTPLALGTQTGGSLLRPAAYCGVVGFKPTFNALSSVGVKPVSGSFDTVGFIARTVADVALAFAAMTGLPASGAALASIEKPRIGLCRTPQWSQAEQYTIAALEDAASRLAKAGASVREVKLAGAFDAISDARASVVGFESSRTLAWERLNFESAISKKTRVKLAAGDAYTLEECLAGQRVLAECRQLLSVTFADLDVLLVPCAPGEAPPGTETGDAVFNRYWTALHVPAVTVPLSTGPSGLPLGAQFVGPFGADYRTLACAAWSHRALAA